MQKLIITIAPTGNIPAPVAVPMPRIDNNYRAVAGTLPGCFPLGFIRRFKVRAGNINHQAGRLAFNFFERKNFVIRLVLQVDHNPDGRFVSG